jgi:6,7-dimethyl-8-ribityllumazine synthase
MKCIQSEPMECITPFDIAVVVSQFNETITQDLQQGALDRLHQLGFTSKEVTVVCVPGAIEIPLVAKLLASKNKFGAIIALGAVIRGETSHYDYVCQAVSDGCQRVALEFNLPVIFGVLTTENEIQARERTGGAHGHKGRDAVDCALAMYSIRKQLI